MGRSHRSCQIIEQCNRFIRSAVGQAVARQDPFRHLKVLSLVRSTTGFKGQRPLFSDNSPSRGYYLCLLTSLFFTFPSSDPFHFRHFPHFFCMPDYVLQVLSVCLHVYWWITSGYIRVPKLLIKLFSSSSFPKSFSVICL